MGMNQDTVRQRFNEYVATRLRGTYMLGAIIIIIEIMIYTLATMNYVRKWTNFKDTTVNTLNYFGLHTMKPSGKDTTNFMSHGSALFHLPNHTACSDGCTAK